MSLLIDIRQPEWLEESHLAEILAPYLPGVRIRVGLDDGPLEDVVMLATPRLYPDVAAALPGLKLIQKLGAGVETMMTAPDLPPDVRIARLTASAAADEIAEYCLAYVLAGQRHLAAHQREAASGVWRQIVPHQRSETTVAVLGLGHIGARTAALFAMLGFPTLGWSRSAKEIEGVTCHAGEEALGAVLAEADYVCAILPSTDATRDLFHAGTLAQMKPGATLINCGRGDLIVDADLLDALDRGRPGHAVLDVFREEPLPPSHPYWRHACVTVTPHVSGWRVEDSYGDIAENYQRLLDGRPLLNEVDRRIGY